MVYKILGMTIPKPLREKFAKGGADFSDFFPVTANKKATHAVFKSALGFVESLPNPTQEQLEDPSKKKKEKKPKIDPEYV